MVNYAPTANLDSIFSSLSDPTRRDIIGRLTQGQLTVSEIAADYDISLPAVSKHLKVLERAKLIIKRRRGKEQMVSFMPQAMVEASKYLEWYQQFMVNRYESLDEYLNKED